MFVIVTGGRDFADEQLVRHALKEYMHDGDVLVQGGARGADRLAKRVAEEMGHLTVTVHANWGYHGKKAGPMRNGMMLKLFRHDLRYVVAFPGGKGTGHMVDATKRLGIDIREVG